MSYFFSTLTSAELKAVTISLEILLNNLNQFSMEDYIYLSGNIPTIIRKVKCKEKIDNTEISIIAISLVYLHEALNNSEAISESDKQKILQKQSIYDKLYNDFKFFAPIE